MDCLDSPGCEKNDLFSHTGHLSGMIFEKLQRGFMFAWVCGFFVWYISQFRHLVDPVMRILGVM